MFVTEPVLGILPAPDMWVLKSPAVWSSADLEATIPIGFVTDLASIPRLLRGILDVDGDSRLPAILHDSLYCCQETSRSFADEMLRDALIEYGESIEVATVYYAGVRVGGWAHWGSSKRPAGLQLMDFDTPSNYERYLQSGAKVVTRWRKD